MIFIILAKIVKSKGDHFSSLLIFQTFFFREALWYFICFKLAIHGHKHCWNYSEYIGVGRFRILGGQGLEYWGGGKGSQSRSRHMTSYRRNDVASTSFRRHVPTRFFINQCQIITFLILKSDIIENSRIELRGIVVPVPSNQTEVTLIIILPFNFVHLWFFPFHREIEGKCEWIIEGQGGGGGKEYVPPSQTIGGLATPIPPLPTPME